jgi:hypothetical protein
MASTQAVNDMAVKSENVLFVRYSKVTPKADDPSKVEKVDVALLQNPKAESEKELTDKGYAVEFKQTVRVDEAGTWDGCAQIIPDEEERVIIFNRGLASKLNQKLNSKFRETNEDGTATYQSTEDVYDPSELLNDPTRRRNLSPIDKAIAGLSKSGLSADAIAAAVAALQAAMSAQG